MPGIKGHIVRQLFLRVGNALKDELTQHLRQPALVIRQNVQQFFDVAKVFHWDFNLNSGMGGISGISSIGGIGGIGCIGCNSSIRNII
jgi:hypothetical protein